MEREVCIRLKLNIMAPLTTFHHHLQKFQANKSLVYVCPHRGNVNLFVYYLVLLKVVLASSCSMSYLLTIRSLPSAEEAKKRTLLNETLFCTRYQYYDVLWYGTLVPGYPSITGSTVTRFLVLSMVPGYQVPWYVLVTSFSEVTGTHEHVPTGNNKSSDEFHRNR